jgi:hypothetical protein
MSVFKINTSHHSCGDSSCDECIYGYPRKCRCGGYVHAEHVGSEKGGSSFKYLCDKCYDRFLKQPSHDFRRKPKRPHERKKS